MSVAVSVPDSLLALFAQVGEMKLREVAHEISSMLSAGRAENEIADLVTAQGTPRALTAWLVAQVRQHGSDLAFITKPPRVYSDPPPAKSKNGLVAAGIAIIVLGLIGFGFLVSSSPSGVKVDGKDVSVGEGLASIGDVRKIAAAYESGDMAAVDKLPGSHTTIGKKMIALLKEQGEIGDKFAEEMTTISITDISEPSRLTSAKGRKQSRADIDKFRHAVWDWRTSTQNWMNRYNDFIGSLGSDEKIGTDVDPVFDEFKTSSDTLADKLVAIVDFAEKVQPEMKGSKLLLYDEDYDKMMALIAKEEVAAKDYEKVLHKMMSLGDKLGE